VIRLPPVVAQLVDAAKAPSGARAALRPQRTAPASAHSAVTASREERMTICRACEFAKKLRLDALQCTKCGCICQFKTAIPAAHCPINKW